MPRPQFTLKTLLWLVLAVAAFFAGMKFDRQLLNWQGKMILVKVPGDPEGGYTLDEP